jgi:hypothetical protein
MQGRLTPTEAVLMLYAKPLNPFSWTYTIRDQQPDSAELCRATLCRTGRFIIDGRRYTVRREHLDRGRFVLETADGVVAVARIASPRRRFELDYAGRSLTVEPISTWRPVYEVGYGRSRIGTVRRRGLLGRRLEADLPAELPPAVQLFIAWLVLWLARHSQVAASLGVPVPTS